MLLKPVTVMNQTLEGYTSRFWKNIFRPNYIDLVQSVQIYLVCRYPATGETLLFCKYGRGQRGKPTLNLACFQTKYNIMHAEGSMTGFIVKKFHI